MWLDIFYLSERYIFSKIKSIAVIIRVAKIRKETVVVIKIVHVAIIVNIFVISDRIEISHDRTRFLLPKNWSCGIHGIKGLLSSLFRRFLVKGGLKDIWKQRKNGRKMIKKIEGEQKIYCNQNNSINVVIKIALGVRKQECKRYRENSIPSPDSKDSCFRSWIVN